MTSFPLSIGNFTAIRISPNKGVEHSLYAVSKTPTDVKVYNIPPFFNRASLNEFFSSFGPVTHLYHDKNSCSVLVSYELKDSADTLLSTSMSITYAVRLPKATLNQVVVDSKKSWLKDSEALKNESEEFLQKYFKEKLSKDESSDEDSDEWVVVKPKKRRMR
ncbi:unnamed protein product [Mesocestoides corti]|uniref:RRM domain-containing protein n=1 Tax=Mesocestoides corti TaxID=53468 RepID=A0A158QS62_MESCO|nr:unnamed protein product [Mesocestoides corti]